MPKKLYALVGSFNFREKVRGITVFACDGETGALRELGRYVEDMNVGQQTFDPRRGLVYAVDENKTLRGNDDGGGRLAALGLDPGTGVLTPQSVCSSLSALPSWISVDPGGEFAVVSHFCSDHYVTKVVEEAGGYRRQVQFDDAVLALLRLEADGSLGEVCDAAFHRGTGGPGRHTASHLHCAASSPDGEVYAVCDMGTDTVHTYGIDRGAGRLVHRGQARVEDGCSPRYGAFHPTMPYFFTNNETRTVAHAFRYDGGAPELVCMVPLFSSGESEGMPSDLKVHPRGHCLYVAVRGIDQIAVLEISPDGYLAPVQAVDSGGKGPRGLCLTPDGRFLYALNRDSGSVDVFSIHHDGTLHPAGRAAEATAPGNMQILAAEE